MLSKSKGAKSFYRILSVVLTAAMLIGLFPSGVFADGDPPPPSDKQIVKNQQTGTEILYFKVGKNGQIGEPVDANDEGKKYWNVSKNNAADSKVQVSKSIEGTNNENEFDITLEVKTKDVESVTPLSKDTAVVLVIDISGSMGNTTADNSISSSKLSRAFAAAAKFVENYKSSEYGGGARWLQIIWYDNNAKTQLSHWMNVANSLDAMDAKDLKDALDVSTVPLKTDPLSQTYTDGNRLGTNTEAGLQLAYNLYGDTEYIKDVPLANHYTILLTDGASSDTIRHESDRNRTDVIRGYSQHEINNGGWEEAAGTLYPTSYPSYTKKAKGHQTAADLVYNTVTKTGTAVELQKRSKIFSIGYDITNEYTGGTNATYTEHVGSWLNRFSTPLNADTENELLSSFQTILHSMLLKTLPWNVKDPMGENIVFLGSDSTEITFGEDSNTLYWYLSEATGPDSDGWKTYTCTYRIKLNNLADFTSGHPYLTNGQTTLTYRFLKSTGEYTDESGENVVTGDDINQYIDFYIPKVLGYAVDLSFLKVAAHNEDIKIQGAEFILTRGNDDELPGATSGGDGLVTFGKVPSGFAYTLSETIAHTDYNLSAETVNIKIDYGVIYYQPDGEGGAWEPFPCVNAGYYKFENELNSKPETLYVQKRWIPAAPQDGSEITVKLIQYKHIGNEKNQVDDIYRTVTLSAANNWLESIEVPTVDASTGYKYSYGVKELDSPEGYTEIQHPTEYVIEEVDSSSEGKENVFILTNKSDATTSIEVEKKWIVPTGHATPDVYFNIARGKYENDEFIPDTAFAYSYEQNPLTLTSATGYTGSFTGLDVYDDDGNFYDYEISETALTGYTQYDAENLIITASNDTVNDYTAKITNIINYDEMIPLSIQKNWVDDGDAYDARPDEVTFELTDSIGSPSKTIVLSAPTWSYNSKTDENLLFPVYDTEENGKVVSVEKIEYALEEVNGDANYIGSVFETVEDQVFTATNTYKEKIYISVNKVWNGEEPQGGYPYITLHLWQNGVKVDEATLSGGTTFHTFTGQEKLDPSGIPYEYVVTEDPVAGWYVQEPNGVDTDDESGNITVTLTNNKVDDDAKTAVSGTKIWRQPGDAEKHDVTVVLEQWIDGPGEPTPADPLDYDTADLSESNKWQYSFTDLPAYDEDIIQVPVTDINGDPVYDINGDPVTTDEPVTTPYIYKVREENGGPSGYETEVEGYNIINTITGDVEITVDKSWIWPDGVEKPDVTIEVYHTAELEGTLELEASKPLIGSSVSFDSLPKYDDMGRLYIYSVKEVKGAGTGFISTPIDTGEPYSFSFKNTIAPTLKPLTGTKNWGHPEGTAPPEITLNLLQDGEVVATGSPTSGSTDRTQTVQFMNSDNVNSWPTYDEAGRPYVYTVTETAAAGVLDNYSAHTYNDTLTITNIINQENPSVNVSGIKIWAKPDNMPTPDSIRINLLRAVGRQPDPKNSDDILDSEIKDLTGGDINVIYGWIGLPKYDPATGGEYIYSVSEDYVEGFTSAVGKEAGENFGKYDIVNTVAQKSISITVNKLWRDYTDAELPAPVDSVTVELLRGGNLVAELDLNAANGWTGSFAGLDKYNLENGHEYAYDVRERTEVAGFNTNIGTVTEIADGVYSVDVKNVKKEYQYQVIRDYIVRDEGGRVIYHSDPRVYEDLITVPEPQTVSVTGNVPTRTVFDGSGQTLTYTFLQANSTESVTITEDDFGTIRYMYLYYEYITPGGGGGYTPTPTPTPLPEEEIEDEDTPLAEVIPPAPDDEVVIFEEETPLADLPQTGASVPNGDRSGTTQSTGGANAVLPSAGRKGGGNRGAAV
ncbi:MAG: Cna B-type domain-containing protein [Clostridiales Family XIII bacterium]|jgi:hypothetical protein|nr:Cna B-type domain-containing protein [Clostridiales Family XIII bacterium]